MKKIFAIKKKNLARSIFAIIFAFSVLGASTSFGMQHYYKLDFSTGLVTADKLNVRSGPGVQYKVVASVSKNEYIRVFAGVGDWYIVQVEGDYVGAVSKKYVKPIYASSSTNKSSGNSTSSYSSLSSDEKEVFDLINRQRANNGLKALEIDYEVQRVAKIKAQDMVDNNYFAHESPTYGTPFNMLTNFKISYRAAGENIAGNSSNSGAVDAWMNSSGHRANILSENYHAVGIGVFRDENTYYWVQLFTDGEGLSPIYTSGNINGDNACNSEDAALILTEAASAGAGGDSILSRMQRSFADINHDSSVDSSDAAMVLQYAAYAGSGGTESVENYFKLS